MKRTIIFRHICLISLITAILILLNTSTIYCEIAYEYPVLPATAPAGSVLKCTDIYSLTHVDNYPVLFVGDSRTVGLQQALSASEYNLSNHSFVAKVGQGYSWLSSQAQTLSECENSPHIIILNLGVNDLGNCTNYQKLYDTYRKGIWKDCPLYIVSVNPVCAPCQSVSNRQIEAFNQDMQNWINKENASATAETLPIHYIDTYSYLLETGYSSTDGLHYSSDTYLRIYEYIMTQIEEPVGDGSGFYSTSSSCGNCIFQVRRRTSITRS
jgi:lysophospholipase L1-like esterase